MEWILVKAVGLINSKDRAHIIARELYNIMRPVHVQSPEEAGYTLCSILQHPTDRENYALRVDTDYMIAVHPECNLEKLVAMFPEISASQRYNLSSAIHQLDEIPLHSILPNTVTVRDYQYMVDNGWIIPDRDE